MHIGDGAGIEHEATDAFFGEDFGGHAAGVAGADDENVYFFFRHVASVQVEVFSKNLRETAIHVSLG
jgi:hypothetical protein